MVALVAGPGVVLTIRAKYRTFTPDQFTAAFLQEGYTGTQVTANISDNPMAAPVPTVMYSKDGLLIFFNDNENTIKFHIINRRDVADVFDSAIKNVLRSLDYHPPAVDTMRLEMSATVSGMGSPPKTLKSLIRRQLADKLEEIHSVGNVTTTSLKVTQSNDDHTEFLTTTIEPLNTDQEKSYFVGIEYVTKDNDKFTEYVSKMGDGMVESVIYGVENGA